MKIKHICLSIHLSIIVVHLNGQLLSHLELPQYDSIDIKTYNQSILSKTYFLENEKVFFIGYNYKGNLYHPSYILPWSKIDSCYAEIREGYFLTYLLTGDLVIKEKYSYNSNILDYHKYKLSGESILKGKYQLIKDYYYDHFKDYNKFKIGKWNFNDSTQFSFHNVDFDSLIIDNKPISYKGLNSIIDSSILIASNHLKKIYGNQFYTNFIKLNFDKSTYTTNPRKSAPIMRGHKLYISAKSEIYYIDLVFDIIIDTKRYNTYVMRVDRNGQIIDKLKTNDPGRYRFISKWNDSRSEGKFHDHILNWKIFAKKHNFKLDKLNSKFHWIYGEKKQTIILEFVIEELSKTEKTNNTSIKYIRQLRINPWDGTNYEKIEKIIEESIE